MGNDRSTWSVQNSAIAPTAPVTGTEVGPPDGDHRGRQQEDRGAGTGAQERARGVTERPRSVRVTITTGCHPAPRRPTIALDPRIGTYDHLNGALGADLRRHAEEFHPGVRVGVRGTPTPFVNGTVYRGPITVDALPDVLPS